MAMEQAKKYKNPRVRVQKLSKKEYEDGGMMAKGGTTESSDRKYSALKSGKRTSRKYASVEMRGGGVYHRRNANQYGKVKGGKTYYEYSENRTDSKRYLEKGGNTEISHYKVNDKIFVDYMDAMDYCDKNKLSYSKIVKTKKH
jgi:hypothetical protein